MLSAILNSIITFVSLRGYRERVAYEIERELESAYWQSLHDQLASLKNDFINAVFARDSICWELQAQVNALESMLGE